MRAVVDRLKSKRPVVSRAIDNGAVENIAVALTDVLHKFRGSRADRGGKRVKIIKKISALGKRNLAVRRLFALLCGERRNGSHTPSDYFTESVVCGGPVACLGKRRAVIVAGYSRLVHAFVYCAVVCAVHKSEVRAAVEHIEIKGSVKIEKSVHVVRKVLSLTAVMRLSPMVEPTVPIFTAHKGLFGEIFVHCLCVYLGL